MKQIFALLFVALLFSTCSTQNAETTSDSYLSLKKTQKQQIISKRKVAANSL